MADVTSSWNASSAQSLSQLDAVIHGARLSSTDGVGISRWRDLRHSNWRRSSSQTDVDLADELQRDTKLFRSQWFHFAARWAAGCFLIVGCLSVVFAWLAKSCTDRYLDQSSWVQLLVFVSLLSAVILVPSFFIWRTTMDSMHLFDGTLLNGAVSQLGEQFASAVMIDPTRVGKGGQMEWDLDFENPTDNNIELELFDGNVGVKLRRNIVKVRLRTHVFMPVGRVVSLPITVRTRRSSRAAADASAHFKQAAELAHVYVRAKLKGDFGGPHRSFELNIVGKVPFDLQKLRMKTNWTSAMTRRVLSRDNDDIVKRAMLSGLERLHNKATPETILHFGDTEVQVHYYIFTPNLCVVLSVLLYGLLSISVAVVVLRQCCIAVEKRKERQKRPMLAPGDPFCAVLSDEPTDYPIYDAITRWD
jgi:hypothetical protein